MRKIIFLSCLVLAALTLPAPARAHFGMIIPSTSTVVDQKDSGVKFSISFSHPAERRGMRMEKPRAFSMTGADGSSSLLSSLKPAEIMGAPGFTADVRITRPGVYAFTVDPEPYFEPAEDCFIVHQAKTVVAAYGAEDGWDKPAGMRMEIVPLTRPFGNYAGNVFRGVVLLEGRPLPGAVVEVEALGGADRAPNEYYVTQSVRTDEMGVFSFGVPWAGWWGFAALADAQEKMKHEGQDKPVELGATLWLEFARPGDK